MSEIEEGEGQGWEGGGRAGGGERGNERGGVIYANFYKGNSPVPG